MLKSCLKFGQRWHQLAGRDKKLVKDRREKKGGGDTKEELENAKKVRDNNDTEGRGGSDDDKESTKEQSHGEAPRRVEWRRHA